MTGIFLALLPDFALIALGGVLVRIIPAEGWAGIDRLNFLVLFPALIFVAASSRQPAGADLLVIGLGVWAIQGLGFGLGWLARAWGPDRFLDFAGLWQCAWRFNTALAFVAIQPLPDQYAALMSIALGLGIPLANILAVGGLSRGKALSLGQTLKQIALNPFLLASAGGITLSILGWQLPDVVLHPVTSLSKAALPIALLSLGAALRWGAIFRLDRFALAFCGIKLVALPVAAYGIGTAIGLSPVHVAVLTIFAALPTSSAAHILASVFGADRRAVSTLIAQSTLIGCVTLPIWIAVAVG
jgi:predicted permease